MRPRRARHLLLVGAYAVLCLTVLGVALGMMITGRGMQPGTFWFLVGTVGLGGWIMWRLYQKWER